MIFGNALPKIEQDWFVALINGLQDLVLSETNFVPGNNIKILEMEPNKLKLLLTNNSWRFRYFYLFFISMLIIISLTFVVDFHNNWIMGLIGLIIAMIGFYTFYKIMTDLTEKSEVTISNTGLIIKTNLLGRKLNKKISWTDILEIRNLYRRTAFFDYYALIVTEQNESFIFARDLTIKEHTWLLNRIEKAMKEFSSPPKKR